MRKLILYVTAFISGFVLMGFELFGTRILAPFFGSGMHVWGAMIAIVMGGISIGYALGGIAADKKEPVKLLRSVLLTAGILLMLFPLYANPVCNLVDSFQIGRKTSTLITAVAIFIIPAFFMGMTAPVLVKLEVREVESVGAGSGAVYSITTAGSIAGTLVTAFLLVGAVPSLAAVASLGVLLCINSVVIAVTGKRIRGEKSE